jgi:biopolymer transport protein ExbB/TolQ
MTVSDGGILFAACALAFALGYAIGAVRVCRFVSKELTKVSTNIEQNSHELRQIYSRLSEENHSK